MALKVKEGIYWVGVIDWNLREFHGYLTDKGTTYNSYLVLDEKVVLFDTVKSEFFPIFLDNIKEIIDPKEIDLIVVNHVEMDHSGALPKVMEIIKPEKLICSPKGKEHLIKHFHREDWPYEVVKSGDQLPIGKRTIKFLETRMLHWPDSMFSLLVEDGILISQDAFGQHYATYGRFDDEVDQAELMRQAKKYYANILLPYSGLVSKLVEEVEKAGLKFEVIAPDHGVIWRKDPDKIIQSYKKWSAQQREEKVVIVYDTMWHSTELLAQGISKGLEDEGVDHLLMNLHFNHRSEVITEILDAKAILVGSPTINNYLLPTVADFLAYLKGLKPKGLKGAAFGSYGWSGESVKVIEKELESVGIELISEGLRVNFVPSEEDMKKAREFGRKIGRYVKS
jgi:flavorubredoxin